MRNVLAEVRQMTSLDCGYVAAEVADGLSAAARVIREPLAPDALAVEMRCRARHAVILALSSMPSTWTVRDVITALEEAPYQREA